MAASTQVVMWPAVRRYQTVRLAFHEALVKSLELYVQGPDGTVSDENRRQFDEVWYRLRQVAGL